MTLNDMTDILACQYMHQKQINDYCRPSFESQWFWQFFSFSRNIEEKKRHLQRAISWKIVA
jgi:hypothetical protein